MFRKIRSWSIVNGGITVGRRNNHLDISWLRLGYAATHGQLNRYLNRLLHGATCCKEHTSCCGYDQSFERRFVLLPMRVILTKGRWYSCQLCMEQVSKRASPCPTLQCIFPRRGSQDMTMVDEKKVASVARTLCGDAGLLHIQCLLKLVFRM